jgi:DNA-binding NtrC family response regulator
MPDWFSPVDMVAAARTDAAVLITGTASRAEALARQIHNASGWRHGSFLILDCTQPERVLDGMLSEYLLADPAIRADAPPRPQRSQDGTVFLRDVDALPRKLQARLADWLEHLRRPGSRYARRRLMASSSRSLLPRIADRTFDDRLYYRLNVIHVMLPAVEDVRPQG